MQKIYLENGDIYIFPKVPRPPPRGLPLPSVDRHPRVRSYKKLWQADMIR